MAETHPVGDCIQGFWEGTDFTLAERIFDPADYLWLRDELGHPGLARALARSRKRVALHWLSALERSFEDLVRVAECSPPQANRGEVLSSWQPLARTLRFHFLLGYAQLVVRIFGPYHRLVPRLNWCPPVLDRRLEA